MKLLTRSIMPDAKSESKADNKADYRSVAEIAAAKRLDAAWLRELGVEDVRGGGLSILYCDEDGGELFRRERGTPTCQRKDRRFHQPPGVKLRLYGLQRLDECNRVGHAWLAEGESDTWALWAASLPALGLPGKDLASCIQLDDVAGLNDLYVLPDNQPPGDAEKLLANTAKRLTKIGWSGRLWRVSVPAEFKDVSDWRTRDPERFKEELTAALRDKERVELSAARRNSKTHERNGQSHGNTQTPRTIAPYYPFPVEALPPVARSLTRQGADALGCDPAFVALPVLSVLASVIGNTRTIRLKRGWTEPAVLWTAIVGDSGTLKSPAFALGINHLYTAQERLFAEYKHALVEYQNELLSWKAAKKEDGTNSGDKPEPPTPGRVIVSDTTIEKLAEILEDNPRGILVGRDELSGWIGSFTKYKGKQGGSDVPNWLELNRAGTLIVDRKTGERRTLFVKRAAASVTGGIQPGVLARALTADLLDSGLAARLLLCYPPRRPKVWTEAEIDPDTERIWGDLLEKLLSLDFDKDREGRPVPRVLRLSADAKSTWTRWYNCWAQEQAQAEGEMAAALSKLEGYAARLALLYHVVSYAALGSDDAEPISVEAIEAGIGLAEWFAGEARRIYSTLSESAEERDTRRLIEYIRERGGEITPRDLWKSNTCRYRDTEHAESVLSALADTGEGEMYWRPAGPRGGRPTRAFRLATPKPQKPETYPDEEWANGESEPQTPCYADETPEIPEEM